MKILAGLFFCLYCKGGHPTRYCPQKPGRPKPLRDRHVHFDCGPSLGAAQSMCGWCGRQACGPECRPTEEEAA